MIPTLINAIRRVSRVLLASTQARTKACALMAGTAFVGLFLTMPPASAAVITFTDQTFDDSNWSSFELIDTTPGNTFVFSAAQSASGGNPGTYRRITQSSSSVGSVSIATGHLFAAGFFDPGEDGLFASLDFRIDGISINSTAGAVGYGLLLVQSGRYYVASGFGPTNGAGWQTLLQTGYTGPELIEVLAGGGFDAGSHPDFSIAGGSIQFGFFTSNGTFGNSFNEGGADNWSVTIHTRALPEPGTSLLLLTGFAIAFLRRRIQRTD